MSTLKNKVSIQIDQQLPEFVRSENPNFVAFMKAYYEFMESAELVLTTLGSIDSILLEAQPVDASATNYVILEDTNRYRPDQQDTILLEDTTTGAFVNAETITGDTSGATAVIRTEDINDNSRLFISSQNDFLIGETVTGGTSNATGVISDYTANPVQNIQQLMQYADVDETIDQFFNEFKEAFLRTIPKDLTAGVNERNLLKNIKDLYRSKGTKKGHELFFRILLNEEPILYYPTKDMLRVSAGTWIEDQILRVTLPDDTILMEDASATSGDIFILNEDGGQIKLQDSVTGTSDLLKLIGQEITQAAVTDTSILSGGAYYGLGYSVIGVATALIDNVVAYTFSGEKVYELIISTDSVVGTFATGHTITATANDDADVTITGKLASILTSYDLTNSVSSQYYALTDPLTVSGANGSDAAVSIDSLTSGTITEMIVDDGGSGYEAGDIITVNNANTNGAALEGKVTIVDGGIAPEAGNLVGEVNIGGEFGVIQLPNLDYSDDGVIYNERIGQEWGTIYNQSPIPTPWPPADSDIILEDGFYLLAEDDRGFDSIITEDSKTASNWSTRDHIISETYVPEMIAQDHIVLQPRTVYSDGAIGNKIVQQAGGGTGDITDVQVIAEGYGYITTPLLTLPTTGSRTGGTVYAKGTGVGKVRDVKIVDAGVHYTDTTTIDATTNFLCTDISGTFTLNETVTGGTSGATGIYKATDATRNIIKLSNIVGVFVGGDEKSGETITGSSSPTVSAVINSYTLSALKASHGTLGVTSGKFLNQDGFISDDTKKIQDSYYYQDYSYVVKTASSINTWRDRLIASVHPAGWEVFGQVDIATAVQSIANITSIVGLGGLYKLLYTTLIGRRLGTADQGTINPNPDTVIDSTDKANATPCLRVTGTGRFTNGQVITGSSSGATGLVFSDTDDQPGHRLVFYTSLTGIFTTSDTITAGAVTAVVTEVHGLLGQYDLLLRRYLEIKTPSQAMTGQRYGFAPAYRDIDVLWLPSLQAASSSSRTFGSMNVYPVYINMITDISGAINASVTTIPVTATDNLPTAGTIKLGTEEITYTGRSSASGAGNLTGATRGANSTVAASHVINTNLTEVRNAVKVHGWLIEDLALFSDQLTPITFGRVAQGYANDNTSWLGSPKNPRCIDAEITVGKT